MENLRPVNPMDGILSEHFDKQPTTNSLTKREMFAMAAMQGILSNAAIVNHNQQANSVFTDEVFMTGYCSYAIKYADELLKQLEK
jgi:hypothetical protein